MHAIRSALALALVLVSTQVSASFVPNDQDVVGAVLQGQGFAEGYVELNRTQGTISIVLQPATAAAPAQDYFFTKVSRVFDECGSVTYTAEQSSDVVIKVSVVDNAAWNYGQCPTFAPLDATAVTVEQTIFNGAVTQRVQETLGGSHLTAVRY